MKLYKFVSQNVSFNSGFPDERFVVANSAAEALAIIDSQGFCFTSMYPIMGTVFVSGNCDVIHTLPTDNLVTN